MRDRHSHRHTPEQRLETRSGSLSHHRANGRASIIAGQAGLIFAAITYGTSALAGQTRANPPQNPPQVITQGRENQNGPLSSPGPNKGISPAAKRNGLSATPDKQEGIPKWTDIAIAFEGFGSLVFTAMLWFSTHRLWRETKRLARGGETQSERMVESIREAERAATAMANVATAMSANVQTAREMSIGQRSQLRAYVFPNSGSLFSGLTVAQPQEKRAHEPFLQIEIRNSGPTPAYKVNSWAQIEIIEPIREDTLVVPSMQILGRFSLGAFQSFPKGFWLGRDLTNSEIEDVVAGVKRIYFFGRVEYISLEEERFTNFRLFYSGIFPPNVAMGLTFAENGNDAN